MRACSCIRPTICSFRSLVIITTGQTARRPSHINPPSLFSTSSAQVLRIIRKLQRQQRLPDMASQDDSLKFDNSGRGPLQVPGIGFPVDISVNDEPHFSHGANDFKQEPRLTAREVSMLRLMNALTDKPSWHTKVFDEDVVAKWKAEALGMPLVSEKVWEWCLEEMRDKARDFEKTSRVLTLDAASRVCKADGLVDEATRQNLIAAVQPLLSCPDGAKDWHPNSNEQVLNLVHPSLFPLVYGRSPVLMEGGEVKLDDINAYGDTAVAPAHSQPEPPTSRRFGRRHQSDPNNLWSKKFQWLPCEVAFTGESPTDVRITSYINNLHPREKKLYALIEKLISLSIKPWNDVLIEDDKGRNPVRISTYGAQFGPDQPEWIEELWKIDREKDTNPEAYAEALVRVQEYIALEDDHDPEEDDGTGDIPLEDPEYIPEYGLHSAAETKFRRLRYVLHPEPGVAYSYEGWKAGKTASTVFPVKNSPDHETVTHEYYDVKLEEEFRQQGLQVIVKLSGIELTPEKPTYAGGSWHIEGMLNEHIVATAIYYYDAENVTDSRLSFRAEAMLDEDLSYEQDDHEPLAEIFGIESLSLRDEPALQELGSVATPAGRLLAFPNTLQHRVEPFELADPTRPGHRRFVVLWLVDPHYRVCSTRNVPPQQHSWWAPEVFDKVSFRGKVPPEIFNMIQSDVGEWPMGLEEARALRLELMAERTRGQEAIDAGVEEYNFCEH
ncbi:hypothetical protein BX600DRAFT_466486 [Xylariales sp. PMI_506]|nr:hypothetical protein BX600DRAFT_466486 [Xylariales sp. PMI_506]